MKNKMNISKEVKNEILSCNCNYDYINELLEKDFEKAMSGLLNALLYLFRKVDNINNKETLDNIIILLNNYLKEPKHKKTFDKMYDKIQVFLDNISKSLDWLKLIEVEKYISSLINIQNKCIMNPHRKNKSDKYYFMRYLIFDRRDIELLHKYMLDNSKEILMSNSILSSIFSDIIERYIEIDEENHIEIKYYNQVINLFLKGKIYDKLLKEKMPDVMNVLKNSDKNFVWNLIDKIEGELFTTKEEIGKEYSVSFIFPKDLEVLTYNGDRQFDFTHQNIITIDGEDDLCLDDALYIEKNNNGTYTFYIHLANVPSIIPYNSNVMQEALRRGETIYLPDMEIPIYPEYLANDMLSILPNKRTNTFTFVMVVDTDFSILLDTVKIIPGVVINRNKLSYEKVDHILKKDSGDELSDRLRLLSNVIQKLSKDNLKITALHKVQNIITGNNNTNSAKATISEAHSMVENSMIFSNRLPYILNQYHNLGLVLPWRVQPECTEDYIKEMLQNINHINRDNGHFKKIVKNYMASAKYSPINIRHAELGINGYVRISSPARRALDAVAQYALYDQYINRDKGSLDEKYYFWEREIRYWCEYENNRISENNNFINEYSYLRAKGKILEKK